MDSLILVHKGGKYPIKVLSSMGDQISFAATSCVGLLWELGEKYPECIIGWCDERFLEHVSPESWEQIFHHKLIMASFGIETSFLPPALGYIDQFPFVNVNRKVSYGTWQMSTDVGGIYGSVLLKFRHVFHGMRDFGYVLNSIGKLGQQNGLICFNEPNLVDIKGSKAVVPQASVSTLFAFVFQHYKSLWVHFLLIAFIWYEKKFPLQSYLGSFFHSNFFNTKLDLSKISIDSNRAFKGKSMDVIIPTLGRANYLYEVLRDLSRQTSLPQKVIIVEQNALTSSQTELSFLQTENWPFKLIHHFTHTVGVCKARNLALESVQSDWVFFADDDIRFEPDLLEKCLKRLNKFGATSITTSCLQPFEEQQFKIPKQWGSFGSGHSIVAATYLKKVRFGELFEYGYGEDIDFGMQLRNKGCDIFYDPELAISHLKAPIGGFRHKVRLPWADLEPEPKPSPTLMAFIKKYYSVEQLQGYRMELFFRYYRSQDINNPLKYIKTMRKRWDMSEGVVENMNAKFQNDVVVK